MVKQKITAIKESYKVKRKERDSFGKLIDVEKTFVRFKEVPVVEGWSRFGHYLLDVICYYVFAFTVAIPIVFILMALGFNVEELNEDGTFASILDRLISWLVIYPGYFVLFESTLGSTPGKLILGRIVENEYGEKPDLATIIKRSYIRVIPFEAFSCFSGRGWHDTWTDTFVISKKNLKDIELAMQISQIDDKTHSEPEMK